MRIVFVGAVDFSHHCLKELISNGGNVVAVFTLAKECAARHSDYADLSDVTRRHAIPLHQIRDINDSKTVALISSLRPDVIMVLGWSQLVSGRVLGIAPLGCIGAHPAALPRNRGRHPLIWALVEGLSESALTFLFLDEETDSGDILWQRAFPIGIDDDAASLYGKIKALATEAIKEFLPQLAQGVALRIPQDHAQATYWPKRSQKDGEIDWHAPTMKTYNLIRALASPYPGAHTYLAGDKMVIWRAVLPEAPLSTHTERMQPGTVFACGEAGLGVRTGDSYLTVVSWDTTSEAAIRVGTRLGSR